ncbi:hypothetical protein E2C01_067029 [Portunus trituberculatus]|uniref:Uncharacterized protein n=1 Tax=Portunus trituberculatus TaxID=210409 RepID=A0A5B7HTY6_PORTR|nr:hypothetical protein [Portunus trituberculatus]
MEGYSKVKHIVASPDTPWRHFRNDTWGNTRATSSLHHARLITTLVQIIPSLHWSICPITAQVMPLHTHLPALGTGCIALAVQTPQADGTEGMATGGQQQWPVVLSIIWDETH